MRDPTGRRWPIGIAAVLLLTMGANAGVYWAANDSNAAAVEPDYYRKAVEWDSTLAQAARNRALGWSADALLGAAATDGTREVSLTLRDAGGRPVSGAALAVTAIHNSAAARRVEGAGVTDAAGSARLRLPLRHGGLWELRLTATRGPERFTAVLRRETPAPGGLR